MNIISQVKGDSMTLVLDGKMDFNMRKTFQKSIEQAKLSKPHKIVLDVCKVSFIDSAGLGLIMLANKTLKESGISLSLLVAEGAVMKVLVLANIGETIPISKPNL